MGDVEMGILSCLFSSILPDVRAENFSTSSKDHVSTCVEGSKSHSSLFVDSSDSCLADDVSCDVFVKEMQDSFADLLSVDDFVLYAFNCQCSNIILLSS